ncbi:hypothetical protein L1987_87963 [Smallanthus sonchifolius]|nr:hypothetical protein L1987_87963 [Smallanthus sonchifolius]
MASLKSGLCIEITKFKFHDGMVLQVDVSMFLSGHNAKVKLQLQNCSQTWILHWGCISNGNKKWFVPSFYPSGTTVYKKAALCTPFIKVKNNDTGNSKCLLNDMSHKENIEKPLKHSEMEVAMKIACLSEHVDRGDISKLKTIQETVLQMRAPRRLVWASKWNEGAYISCRKTNTNYDKLCIGILIQEYIRADYAFVTYTYHPVSQDSSEIYTEIVKGSVETLVGASLGRPMSSITKKSDLKSPIVRLLHLLLATQASLPDYTQRTRGQLSLGQILYLRTQMAILAMVYMTGMLTGSQKA